MNDKIASPSITEVSPTSAGRVFSSAIPVGQNREETKECRNDWLHLKAGTILRFDATTPFLLGCSDGLVWITRAGDLRDYIVGPGQSLTVGGTGVVVIEALRASRIFKPSHEADYELERCYHGRIALFQ